MQQIKKSNEMRKKIVFLFFLFVLKFASADFRESQFQGAMLGVLMGDSIGLPFEGLPSQPEVVEKYFANLHSSKDIQPKRISDDTSMTISVGLSLLECRGLTIKNMVRRFVKQFFLDPTYYGRMVGTVFEKLRDTDFTNVFDPAKNVAHGEGSWGNGAAMRVVPIPLFLYGVQNKSQLVNMVVHSARITHAHPLGIAGAVLQTLGVHHALEFGKRANGVSSEAKPLEILATITKDWDALQGQNQSDSLYVETYPFIRDGLEPYSAKLDAIKALLEKGNEQVTRKEVTEKLGTEVQALNSVPTALYIFLASFQPIPSIGSKGEVSTITSFERSIRYAISLGGDTDTIANMAGAMSGAFLGDSTVPVTLLRHCTDTKLVKAIAKRLYQFNGKMDQLPEILSLSALSGELQ